MSTCGACLKPYDLSKQTQVCPHPKREPVTQSTRVLAYLKAHPGSTVMELQFALHPFVSNPRARMSDLRKLGYRIDKVERNGATGFVVVEPARQLEMAL